MKSPSLNLKLEKPNKNAKRFKLLNAFFSIILKLSYIPNDLVRSVKVIRAAPYSV